MVQRSKPGRGGQGATFSPDADTQAGGRNIAGEKPVVFISADESCLGNQYKGRERPGGAAAMLEHWRDGAWTRKDVWTCAPSTTNNRMALTSALVALRALGGPCRVRFLSDSRYLVEGTSSWMPKWKRRGWRRKGGPVENLELWQELDRTAARHEIDWRWVRGHAGDPRNEYVDFLARRAAGEQSRSPPVPSGFEAWLEGQRETHDRFFDFLEFAPPREAM